MRVRPSRDRQSSTMPVRNGGFDVAGLQTLLDLVVEARTVPLGNGLKHTIGYFDKLLSGYTA
jgi:hypothetical protein